MNINIEKTDNNRFQVTLGELLTNGEYRSAECKIESDAILKTCDNEDYEVSAITHPSQQIYIQLGPKSYKQITNMQIGDVLNFN